MSQVPAGMSKVFILDKYFNELQKFWDTEKRLKEAADNGEAAKLESRLRSLSSGLIGLRHCLHEKGEAMLPPTFVASSNYLQGGSNPHSTMSPNLEAASLVTSSPPKPVSSIQHNYSNIHQPIPRPTSLTSSRTQSSNSTAESPTGGVATFSPSEGGAFTKVRTPPMEEAKKSKLAEIDDLIHLDSSISEDLVIRTLQARFVNQKFITNVGPIVLSVNSHRDIGNPLTLTSVNSTSPELSKVVDEALRLQSDTKYPQAIIVSGRSGSGKSHAAMKLLRHLNQDSDAFKYLSAAITVLRSLGSAQTTSNRESSRIGHFIEAQIAEGELYRTKINCYFLDQGRVVKPPPTEKSYHIFYQMLAGLKNDERTQLGLEGYSVKNLHYLNQGDTRVDQVLDAQRFAQWRSSLAVLGIPLMDVLRVLSAILLLGNVEFYNNDSFEVDLSHGQEEMETVARLLGVSKTLLWQGITTRTHTVRGQPVKSVSDANSCNTTRNALAKALYCRTLATIVRRANSMRKFGGSSMSTGSSGSALDHEVASHHCSTVGTSGSRKSSKSMALLNSAIKHATHSFIGILDMFGFEDSKPSQLEQLCINLCSETMQHFYNTHIFKASIESCREEGITSDVSIDYFDNVPCIDLISSLRTGLLSMLDVECSLRGSAETYVQKVKAQHKSNSKLYQPYHNYLHFGIHHYAGPVVYDTSQFLETNRDVIPDDLVMVFNEANFGFASHLFAAELKKFGPSAPRGACFRISSTTSETLLNGDEPVSTLTQDFHTRLDNLLRNLVHAKPHFVRCISPNEHGSLTEFDRNHVAQQIRALQVPETVTLMYGGFPHRMRFKVFNARYRALAEPIRRLKGTENKAVEDCEFIIDCYNRTKADNSHKNNQEWAHGRKYIFLSEGARQELEVARNAKRLTSAIKIQHFWRRRKNVKNNVINNNITNWNQHCQNHKPRPKPISCTPPLPLNDIIHSDRCDFRIIQQTCSLFGLDLERPPPVPPSRPYTVNGSRRITFPQTRIMTHNFPDMGSSEIRLLKGETVVVIGNSSRKGYLVVERNNHTLHVPYQYLQMRPTYC